MTADASYPLQTAVIAALGRQQIDAGFPKENKQVTLTAAKCSAWRSAVFDGQGHEFEFIITGEPDGPLQKVVGRIINILHDIDLDIPGHSIVDFQFESSNTRMMEDETGRSVVTFKALTVAE